jgi:hypothetical protein
VIGTSSGTVPGKGSGTGKEKGSEIYTGTAKYDSNAKGVETGKEQAMGQALPMHDNRHSKRNSNRHGNSQENKQWRMRITNHRTDRGLATGTENCARRRKKQRKKPLKFLETWKGKFLETKEGTET